MNGNKLALEKLTEAKEKKSIVLDLANMRLEEFPREILDLTNLEALYLDGNLLKEIPEEIEVLRNLQALNLGGNRFRSFPIEILKLKQLNELYLYGNEIDTIPADIRILKNLRGFWLESNKLTEFPKGILDLSNLEILHLSNNKIIEIPPQIKKLSKLKEFNLENNRVKRIPQEIVYLENLRKFHLDGNSIENPPIEISMKGIHSIRNYFFSIGFDAVELYEAKVLIVGEGSVGKTWLLKRLLYNKINPNDVSTEGIEIDKQAYEIGEVKDFQVNFWDFGGQEIYHSTHQFFLTKRSVYLFVWAARTDDDLTSFDYWLNIIRLLSDSAPVIVVQNKIDERIKNIDRHSLQDKFTNIVEFHNVSAANGSGISDLLESIKRNVSSLDHIGSTLPKVWVDIRDELENLPNNYIDYQKYESICQKYKLDKDRAGFLSEYYHDLGLFLHFKDNEILNNIVFLKPEWATNAVYKLVDKKEIINKLGNITLADLRRHWDDDYYENHKYLIELMKKFELCFELDQDNFIIPELLSQNIPTLDWQYKNNLKFEYHYDFMPAGIITRFISRNHRLIKEHTYWKNGVVLTDGRSEALIISQRLNRKIKIWIKGKNNQSIFTHINDEIRKIHHSLNYPDVKLMIPCICDECKLEDSIANLYNFDDLITNFEYNQETIFCVKGKQKVVVTELLSGYEPLKADLDKPRVDDEKEKKETKIPLWFNLIVSLGIPIIFIVVLTYIANFLDTWKLPIIIIGSILLTIISVNIILILTRKISPEIYSALTNSVLGKLSLLTAKKE